MWQKLENGIVQVVKELGFENVQLWSGKPEDLLKRPNAYPAIRIVIEKHELRPLDIFNAGFESTFDLSLLVFFKSLRDDGTGAYAIIDRLYRLNNAIVEGYKLTPTGARLLMTDTSEFVFQVSFKAEGREVLHDEKQVLTKHITFEEV